MDNARVVRLLREQHGLISRRQALAAGMKEAAIDTRVARGVWLSAGRGVYRLPSVATGFVQRVMGVTLQGAPHTAASHLTAAWLWGLDGFKHRPPAVIDVTVPLGNQLRAGAGVQVHRAHRYDRSTFVHLRGVPTTSLTRTLIDLAGVVAAPHLEAALESGLRDSPHEEKKLQWVLRTLHPRGYDGLPLLKRLFEGRWGLDSGREAEVKQLIWAAGLPTPQPHFVVCDGNWRIAEVDFAWVAEKMTLQFHGNRDHLKVRQFYRDHDQGSRLVAAGWMPLVSTRDELDNHPLRLMERLRVTFERAKARAEVEGPGEGEVARTEL